MYRSNDIAHKFKMEAVEHHISKPIHVSQKSPKIQYPENEQEMTV